MMITQTQAHKIAAAIAAIREDWDPAGILAALGKVRDRDPAAALIAFARAARDPDMRTPAVAALAGEHWNDPAPSSAERHPSGVRFGDLCQTHGVHRDACGCDRQAYAARQRETARDRTNRWATKIRADLDQHAADRRDTESEPTR
jgi:hypothetical protein